MAEIYDFSAKTLDGENLSLKAFEGQVMLIVNTASACGFTPQYEGLEALQKSRAARGFSVLGFPCNQFGNQESGDEKQIGDFCKSHYDVTFPMFAKIDVNGDKADPLYKFLKQEKPGLLGSTGIKWNFTKFLVDRKGQVVARYSSLTKPDALAHKIDALL